MTGETEDSNLKSWIPWVDVFKKYFLRVLSRVLVLNLRIFCYNLADISYNILPTILMTDALHSRIKSISAIAHINNEKKLNQHYPHIDLIGIQVTDGKVFLDAPVSSLAKITHNIRRKLFVWNMYCFTIITSYDGWRPPPHMLKCVT